MTGTTHCIDRFDGPLAGHRLPAGPAAQGILVWPASGPLAACQAIPEQRFLDADISCQMLRAGCHSGRIHIYWRRSVAEATGQRPHECHSDSQRGPSGSKRVSSSSNWLASSASRSVYHSESGSTTFKARPAACRSRVPCGPCDSARARLRRTDWTTGQPSLRPGQRSGCRGFKNPTAWRPRAGVDRSVGVEWCSGFHGDLVYCLRHRGLRNGRGNLAPPCSLARSRTPRRHACGTTPRAYCRQQRCEPFGQQPKRYDRAWSYRSRRDDPIIATGVRARRPRIGRTGGHRARAGYCGSSTLALV